MSIWLLTFPAALLALGAVQIARSPSTVSPTPNLTEPVRETWEHREFHSLSDAENWLDRLEIRGITRREFEIVEKGRFIVRWQVG